MDNNELPKKLENQANGNEIRLDMFPPDQITKKVLKPDWTFKDSFPGLDLFPFNQLAVDDACFIYAPQDEAEYKPWDRPAEPNKSIRLQKGLNFAAWLKLDGFSSLLTLLQELVGLDSTFKFYGPFDPAPEKPYPTATLSAELSTGDFSIGFSPLTFTLSHPRVVVKVAESEDGAQEITLALHADSSLGLDFSVGISATGDRMTFGAEPIQGRPFTLENILQLPGGGNFQSFIPDALHTIFEQVGLKHLTLIMQTNTRAIRYWEIAVGTTEAWSVIPNVIKLEKLVLQVGTLYLPGISDPMNMVSLFATAKVLPEIFTGEFDFAIETEKATDGKWQVSSIGGQYFGEVRLGDIVRKILKDTVPTVPKELDDIAFSDFGMIVHPAEGSYECYGACLADFPLLGSGLRSSLVINVEYSKQGYRVYLGGVLKIGGQSFSLKVDFSGQEGGSGNLRLTASWEALSLDSYLQIEDIVRALGLTPPNIPPGLDLSLKSASFTYNFKDQTLVLEAESLNYGKAVFAACQNQATHKWQFFFGVAINDINLPPLPLVDEMLPAGQTVKVDKIRVLVASTALDPTRHKAEIGQINALIGEDYPTIPDQGMPNAFAISAQLDLGGYLVPLCTGAAGQPSTGQPERVAQESAIAEGQTRALVVQPTSQTPSGVETAAGKVTWFNVNKNLGPVSFRRVGANFQDGTLWLLLDVSVVAAGLQLSVIGLAVGSPLGKFEPVIDLGGLALSYANPPLEIAGALMKVPAKGDSTLQLDGLVKVKAQSLNLIAIGSYTQNKSGDTSLFVYAMLNKDLGGPPCLFVTGLAAGFGYNRRLTLPPIDQVAEFPLVVTACNPPTSTALGDPGVELAKLNKYLAIETGQYFLAAGVKFTSFKMIESFAMLTVSFGQRLEIGILGLSTIKIPQDGPCLSEIQVALKASYVPDDGFLSVTAQITSASYLLSKDCHPTGGLAFYSWFSGEHAGDFALTVGGYHPAFQVPAHYPQVPRLSVGWQMDLLSIKGSAYFALTPSALMAGGCLEANWRCGSIEAWFRAQMDFIVAWKPFYYDATIRVGMGVACTFWISTWWATWSYRLTADLGVDLHLWGPELSGTAHVQVSFIGFDIGFGPRPTQSPKPIDWQEFKTSFLPDEILSVSVTRGLLDEGKSVNGIMNLGVIDPGNFSLLVDSVIPINRSSNANIDSHNFGIAPMGKPSLDTNLSVSVRRIEVRSDGTIAMGESCNQNFAFAPIKKNIPAGLWGTEFKPGLNSEPLVKGVVSRFEITAKASGVGITESPAQVSYGIEASVPTTSSIKGISRSPRDVKRKELDLGLYQKQASTRIEKAVGMDEAAKRQVIKDNLARTEPRRQRMLTDLGFENEEFALNNTIADEFLVAPQIEAMSE